MNKQHYTEKHLGSMQTKFTNITNLCLHRYAVDPFSVSFYLAITAKRIIRMEGVYGMEGVQSAFVQIVGKRVQIQLLLFRVIHLADLQFPVVFPEKCNGDRRGTPPHRLLLLVLLLGGVYVVDDPGGF